MPSLAVCNTLLLVWSNLIFQTTLGSRLHILLHTGKKKKKKKKNPGRSLPCPESQSQWALVQRLKSSAPANSKACILSTTPHCLWKICSKKDFICNEWAAIKKVKSYTVHREKWMQGSLIQSWFLSWGPHSSWESMRIVCEFKVFRYFSFNWCKMYI